MLDSFTNSLVSAIQFFHFSKQNKNPHTRVQLLQATDSYLYIYSRIFFLHIRRAHSFSRRINEEKNKIHMQTLNSRSNDSQLKSLKFSMCFSLQLNTYLLKKIFTTIFIVYFDRMCLLCNICTESKKSKRENRLK